VRLNISAYSHPLSKEPQATLACCKAWSSFKKYKFLSYSYQSDPAHVLYRYVTGLRAKFRCRTSPVSEIANTRQWGL